MRGRSTVRQRAVAKPRRRRNTFNRIAWDRLGHDYCFYNTTQIGPGKNKAEFLAEGI